MKTTGNKESKKAIAKRSGDIIASNAIEGFSKNGRVCGLTNGAFSLISLIEAVLSVTGPANIVISTWSAGLYDAGALNSLMACGKVIDVKLILDRSFKTRQKGYSFYLQDVFKEENIRTTDTHAKFVLIKNEDWNVCIRSSMNLNENKRCENFDVDDNIDIYNLFNEFANDLFKLQPKGLIESRSIVDPIFDTLFDVKSEIKTNDYYKKLGE